MNEQQRLANNELCWNQIKFFFQKTLPYITETTMTIYERDTIINSRLEWAHLKLEVYAHPAEDEEKIVQQLKRMIALLKSLRGGF